MQKDCARGNMKLSFDSSASNSDQATLDRKAVVRVAGFSD